jgi:hypothetical protein
MTQGYYFEIEKRKDNALTFAYIWREEDDATTAPPVKSFHSMLPDDEAERKVSDQAAKWIEEHGMFV